MTLREEARGPDGGTRGSKANVTSVRIPHPDPVVRAWLNRRLHAIEARAMNDAFLELRCSASATTRLVQVSCTELQGKDWDHIDPSAGGSAPEPVGSGFVARIDGTRVTELTLGDVLRPPLDVDALRRQCAHEAGIHAELRCGSRAELAGAAFSFGGDALSVCVTTPCLTFEPVGDFVRGELLEIAGIDPR